MRPISTNNDSSRHEQQQRPPIPRRILNRYIFAIITPLRQTQKRSSRDSICNAITLTSDEYETLYAEVEREMREQAILCQSLRTTTAKEHIRQIARVVASRQNSPLQSTAPNSRLRTITHLAVRCNHNATRRMRSERRKMRCNHNPKTELRNNNRYAKAIVHSARQSNTVNNAPQLLTILVASAHEQDQILIRTDQLLYVRNDLATEYKDISSLNYTQFIRTLKREVRFEDKRSSIYYYTKTADSWTHIRISTEARWHSALQDTVATKLYRATFVIEPLI
ncbi:hypothetical protein HBI44_244860 [Parastagonospora nodorum]|nr:hypothetical protein HBI44_244860 [Parastagonospora nodorum]